MPLTSEQNAAWVWRDFVDPLAATPVKFEPIKSEIRFWGLYVETKLTELEGTAGSGLAGFETKALMDANTNYPPDTIATVYDDPVPANNGDYIKVGAAPGGSWSGPFAANFGAATFVTATATTGNITTLNSTGTSTLATANVTTLNVSGTTTLGTANIATGVFADARVAAASTANFRMRAGGSATDTMLLQHTAGDLTTLQTRVSGVLTPIWRVQADGDFQVFTRILVGTGQKEVATTDIIPAYSLNHRLWQVDAADVIHGRGEVPEYNDPVTLSNAVPYTIGMDNQDRSIHVLANGAFIDCQHVKVNGEFQVHVEDVASRSVRIFCGSNNFWLGLTPTTSKLIEVTRAQNYRIKCVRWDSVTGVKTFLASLMNSTPVAAASQTFPTYSRSVVFAGQSILLRSFQGVAAQSFQDRLTELSVARDVYIIQTSVGSTGLMKGNSTVGYWWDQDTSALGPLSNDMVTAIANRPSGVPAPTVVFVALGQADSNYMADTGATTFTTYKNAWASWASAVRTATGLSTLKFCILPLGGEDAVANNPSTSPGTLGQARYTATRAAIVQACLDNPTMLFLGPEYYDNLAEGGCSRVYNDVHLDLNGQVALGRRIATHFANLAVGQTNNLGPVVQSVTELSSTSYRVRIQFSGSLKRPDDVLLPDTVKFLPAGTPNATQTPVGITAVSVASAGAGLLDFTFTLASALSGARFAYPYGTASDTAKGLVYRDSVNQPLRSCLI